MLIAYQTVPIQGATALLVPAPVPSNYKNEEAIEKHRIKATAELSTRVADTPCCLQLNGLLTRTSDGRMERPSGPPALWMMGVLQSNPSFVWCFRPRRFIRILSLSCIRMGARASATLLTSDIFQDPFDLIFGTTENMNRINCLRSINIEPEQDSSLEEQMRVLHALGSKIAILR